MQLHFLVKIATSCGIFLALSTLMSSHTCFLLLRCGFFNGYLDFRHIRDLIRHTHLLLASKNETSIGGLLLGRLQLAINAVVGIVKGTGGIATPRAGSLILIRSSQMLVVVAVFGKGDTHCSRKLIFLRGVSPACTVLVLAAVLPRVV